MLFVTYFCQLYKIYKKKSKVFSDSQCKDARMKDGIQNIRNCFDSYINTETE